MKRVDVEHLRKLPAVQFTNTWKPYPHYYILEAVQAMMDTKGLQIVDHRIELNKSAHNMYATLDIRFNKEYNFMLGVRNSTDKSFGLGLCSGCRVVVCANGCFDGPFTIVNIHNNTLTEERVFDMIARATSRMINQSGQYVVWLDALKDVVWDVSTMKARIFDIIRDGIVPPSRFTDLMQCLSKEYRIHTHLGPNILHNAVTRFYKEASIQIAQQRINKLNKYMERCVAPRTLGEVL